MLLFYLDGLSAAEIAAALKVPAVYVEEELEILAQGENGNYGLLRRLACLPVLGMMLNSLLKQAAQRRLKTALEPRTAG